MRGQIRPQKVPQVVSYKTKMKDSLLFLNQLQRLVSFCVFKKISDTAKYSAVFLSTILLFSHALFIIYFKNFYNKCYKDINNFSNASLNAKKVYEVVSRKSESRKQ
jgi:hypothetical protein